MKKSFTFWQFWGFVFTSVLGTLLHFLYDISGQSIIVAPFTAINESIWEHMKLLYFPMLIWSLVEYRLFANQIPNFRCAKLRGFFVGLLLIPVIYYTYTGAFGVFADWFNILIFFIVAATAYISETKYVASDKKCLLSPKISFAIILIIGFFFVIFTFSPLGIPLFQDPQKR